MIITIMSYDDHLIFKWWSSYFHFHCHHDPRIMTSSDQIEATSSGRAVRTNVSFRMSSAPLAFWSRHIHRWSCEIQIYLIWYTLLMLRVFLVNYWYISIGNILRQSIKVFLRRPPRVRNDLDEALFSSEKVIINENTLMISGHWRLKMIWWSGRWLFAKWIYSRNQLFFSPLHRQIFCFFSTFHSWTCPNWTFHLFVFFYPTFCPNDHNFFIPFRWICPRSWTSAFTFRLAKAQFMQLDVWTLGTQLAELHLLPKWKWS